MIFSDFFETYKFYFIFTIYSPYVHYMFTICSLCIHYMFTICSQHVHCMFTLYSLYVHYMFPIYSPYVHFIFVICSLYVHYMFTICSLYVHYMFTIYLLYVHYMFTLYSFYIHYIFTIYSLTTIFNQFLQTRCQNLSLILFIFDEIGFRDFLIFKSKLCFYELAHILFVIHCVLHFKNFFSHNLHLCRTCFNRRPDKFNESLFQILNHINLKCHTVCT